MVGLGRVGLGWVGLVWVGQGWVGLGCLGRYDYSGVLNITLISMLISILILIFISYFYCNSSILIFMLPNVLYYSILFYTILHIGECMRLQKPYTLHGTSNRAELAVRLIDLCVNLMSDEGTRIIQIKTEQNRSQQKNSY